MRYRILRALLGCVARLPLPALYFFADLACPILHHVARYRLRTVRANLRSALPNRTPRELRRIERNFYHHICDTAVETVKQIHLSRQETMQRMTFSGLENVRELFQQGHPYVFVLLGHYGNWEWISSLQYWLPEVHCSQIYHRLEDEATDRLFLEVREKYGGECVEMKSTLRQLLTMRTQHERIVVGFISDQQPKWSAVHHFLTFLNHDTAVFTGAETLARKLGAATVYGHVTRDSRGHYHCHMEPLNPTPAGEGEFPLTDAYMARLERDIEAAPELWLWSHKRWSRTRAQWLERQAGHA